MAEPESRDPSTAGRGDPQELKNLSKEVINLIMPTIFGCLLNQRTTPLGGSPYLHELCTAIFMLISFLCLVLFSKLSLSASRASGETVLGCSIAYIHVSIFVSSFGASVLLLSEQPPPASFLGSFLKFLILVAGFLAGPHLPKLYRFVLSIVPSARTMAQAFRPPNSLHPKLREFSQALDLIILLLVSRLLSERTTPLGGSPALHALCMGFVFLLFSLSIAQLVELDLSCNIILRPLIGFTHVVLLVFSFAVFMLVVSERPPCISFLGPFLKFLILRLGVLAGPLLLRFRSSASRFGVLAGPLLLCSIPPDLQRKLPDPRPLIAILLVLYWLCTKLNTPFRGFLVLLDLCTVVFYSFLLALSYLSRSLCPRLQANSPVRSSRSSSSSGVSDIADLAAGISSSKILSPLQFLQSLARYIEHLSPG